MSGAVAYTRVSTEEQARENQSLAVQKKKVIAYCEQADVKLLKIYEESESARTMQRPQLQQMIAYCRANKKKVGCVVICNLSRLARNQTDQGIIVLELAKLDIRLVSIEEPLTDDSALGQFLRNMLGSVNQLFSDSLSERTKMHMQAAVKRGQYLWKAPVGYVNKYKRLLIDPERAPLVREAFELMASGRYTTADAVLKAVTAMGLTTRSGKKMSKQSFARMLNNRLYAGWIVSGDLTVRGAYEPIITDDLFDRVQERMNARSVPHTKLNEDFPLRGSVLCAACKKPLTSGWSKGRKERYPYYSCWTKGCKKLGSIRRDRMEGQFVSLLSRMEPTAQLLAELPGRIAERWKERKEKIASEAARLSKRLADQRTLNQKALVAKLNGEMTPDEYDLVKAGIVEASDELQTQINALDSERTTMDEMLRQAEAEVVDLASAWNKGNVNQRQELVKSFFPEGLFYSKERGFFEPANKVITEMVMRFLEQFGNVGVPDGI